MQLQYTAIFHDCKYDFQMENCDICLIFTQNIDHGCTLETDLTEAVLTCTHGLYFRAKEKRKKMLTTVNPRLAL